MDAPSLEISTLHALQMVLRLSFLDISKSATQQLTLIQSGACMLRLLIAEKKNPKIS